MTAAMKTAAGTSVALVLGLVTLLGVLPAAAPAEAPATMLEKGIYQEETAGDLDAAMKIYRAILDEAKTDRKFVAQAQYRLGLCLLKKGQNRQAIEAMQALVTHYGDQKDLVAKAQKSIAEAQGRMSPQQVGEIVAAAVGTISTCTEADPRVAPALATLSGLDNAQVVTALTKHLASDEANLRRAAIYVLWKADLSDIAAAGPDLEKLCSHEEDMTRGMAGITLGARKVASSYPLLCKMTLEDASGYARRCAAYALGLLGRADARATLQKALADKDPLVRANAQTALRMLSEGDAAGAAAGGPAAPKVLRTTPADYANDVPDTLTRLTVTFDRKMKDGCWAWVQRYEDKYPQTTGKPSYDADCTTCSLPVKLEPGKVYWIEFNSPPFVSFQALDGTTAEQHALVFATRSADGKPTPIPADLLARAKAINAAARPSSQSQPGVQRRKVDKELSALPRVQDLTTPDGAWAAWQRAQVAKDANAVAALSWLKLDPAETAKFWRDGDPQDMQVYLQAIKDSKLLEVLTWGEDLAAAVGLLPFAEGKGRHPYSLRYLGRIGGQWKNLGEDRCATQNEAAATFERKKQRFQPLLADLARSAPADGEKRAAAALAAEGWRLWGQRKLPEAEKVLRQAVEKDPANANAWNGLGWAQQNQGELLEATRSFGKCLAIDPKVPGAWNGLGWIAKNQGRGDEAISCWRKAIAADPKASAARAGLAGIFMERGEFEFAEKEYQAALLADPTDAAAKTGLATVAKARDAAKAAKAAAEAWLGLLDAGEYGQTYDQASALVKKVTTKEAWESAVKAAVTPLGKPGPRKAISATYMTSLPGAPDGEYVIIQFQTPYEKKKDAVETVTPMKDTDGKWRVSGYYVR